MTTFVRTAILCLGTLTSASLYARAVTLEAGDFITLDTVDDGKVRVSCGSAESHAPICRIRNTISAYQVIVGSEVLAGLGTLDGAIAKVKDLREAGLCR